MMLKSSEAIKAYGPTRANHHDLPCPLLLLFHSLLFFSPSSVLLPSFLFIPHFSILFSFFFFFLVETLYNMEISKNKFWEIPCRPSSFTKDPGMLTTPLRVLLPFATWLKEYHFCDAHFP
jgi:hypothetical protein